MLLGKRLDEVMESALTDQERDIIAMRFGLGGSTPKTLDQIGEQMSVSRERIRQLQVKALDKLQKPRLLEELSDFVV
jgi:RNA polymerase sigma factor (sigma-70 family)